MSGIEVLEKGKEPHDFSVRITYTREAPDGVEAEEDEVSEMHIIKLFISTYRKHVYSRLTRKRRWSRVHLLRPSDQTSNY